MVFLLITIAVILLAAFPAVRCAVCHPGLVTFYSFHDLRDLIRYKKFNNFKCGDLDIYCGYFGAGKTLSLVHKVTGVYNHFMIFPSGIRSVVNLSSNAFLYLVMLIWLFRLFIWIAYHR